MRLLIDRNQRFALNISGEGVRPSSIGGGGSFIFSEGRVSRARSKMV